jgi:spore coat protein U-like protein
MKRPVLFLIALSVVSVPVFAAQQTANLSVTASVAANCTIATAPVAFGAYDPVAANAATDLLGTGTLTVACTKGAAATIDLGQGANYSAPTRRMTAGAGAFLNYALYKDAARTQVWGSTMVGGTTYAYASASKNSVAITVYGTVPQAQDVTVGSYADTVVATINY